MADTATESKAEPAPPLPGPRHRHRRRFVVAVVILAGAMVFLLVEGLGSSLDYFDTVDQALAQRATLGTSQFRLEGVVVPGSIRRSSVGTNFAVSEGGHSIPVANSGSPPQLFQADVPVVVVGHFAGPSSTTFVSNQIMVKHSSDYVAKYPNRVRAPNGSVR